MSGEMIVFDGICNNIGKIAEELNIPADKYEAICRYLAIISIMFESKIEKLEPQPKRRGRRKKEQINAEKSGNNEIGQDISGQSE